MCLGWVFCYGKGSGRAEKRASFSPRLELAPLLQRRKTPRLLQLLLARLALRLFTLRVCQPRACLRPGAYTRPLFSST